MSKKTLNQANLEKLGADAQSTGQSIAAANQQDVSSHMFDWMTIGIGIAALLGSVIIGRRLK